MIVDLEAFLLSDCREHLRLKAEVQLNDPVASRACKVVVMMVAFTQPEGMRPVSELDAVQDLHPHQLLDGPVDCCPPDARVGAAQPLEELLRGKRGAGLTQADQVLRNGAPGPCSPFPELFERLADPCLDVH